MPIDLTVLGRRTDPTKTILLFGAGSSIPSGAPSSTELVSVLAQKFHVEAGSDLNLTDLTTIIENRHSRRDLMGLIRERLQRLQPTRGLLTLPEFEWAGLYTTNYDDLIEKAYSRSGKQLSVIASNFDFTSIQDQRDTRLYKLHGTLNADVSFGHQHRMIITGADYDLTAEYREALYAKFTEQLYTNDAIVIGQSLGDPDLKAVVDEAARVKRLKGAPGKITVFSYSEDPNQALIYETRGLDVCFGGVDDFFAEMAKKIAEVRLLPGLSDDPLDRAPSVYPSTVHVSTARANETGSLARMFNGSPANYADIMRRWTFERDFSDRLETQLASADEKRVSFVLGPAGSGKTTGVRKALIRLSERGVHCWEHVREFSLQADAWVSIDDELRKRKEFGVLFVDDAHYNLHAVNSVVDKVCRHEQTALKIVLISSKPHWNPRLKSASIFSEGEPYELGTLSGREIDSLLDVLDSNPEVAALVEKKFLGFSRAERQRRLSDRCRADMFVCMKNIFASEAFDEIILREFAELSEDYQEAYRRISGMEAAGVRVHRQLVLRTVGIQANQVTRFLEDLDGIIEERTINSREGVFAWNVRHSVIAEIVARYKIPEEDDFYNLLENTIDNLNPSYEIELKSMDEICNSRGGFSRIFSKRKQNVLLRKMISLAPRRRVPRHRLITNLIALGEYENAQAEIRLFENEIRIDGPVQRYKVKLLIERARNAKGILPEDRASMVREAAALAEAGTTRFRDDKNLYAVFLEAGVAYMRYDNDRDIFDRAMDATQSAFDRILDPDLGRTIAKFERIALRF